MTTSLQTPALSAALSAALAFTLVGCQGSQGSPASRPSSQSPAQAAAPTLEEYKGPARAYANHQNLPVTGLALEGYCPVAYFAVNKPVLGDPRYSSDHGGATYYFVSAEAKSAFDQEPEKYVPAYGGWCAFGMAIGDKFPVDPRNFLIVDGKLYVFLKNHKVDARDLWSAGDEKELLRKAQATWNKIRG